MEDLAVAITHQTLSEREELELLADQTVAIGTAIKGISSSDLRGKEKVDVDLLNRLGHQGGFAIVTYGKDNQRWLCRFAPDTKPKSFGALRSLKFAEMKELPSALRAINTIRTTIRELTGDEHEAVLAEASRLKWRA